MFKIAEAQAIYQPLVPEVSIIGNQISGGQIGTGNDLNVLLNSIVYIIIGFAVVLAIFMIIKGGYEYMTSNDSGDKKTAAKRRLQAAFGGLLLAVGAVLILNTINPSITNFTIQFPGIERPETLGIYAGMTNDQIKNILINIGDGQTYGSWTQEEALNYLNSVDNIAKRQTDGSLNITNYWNGDTNTNQQRGNSDNLLRPGSVALSGDIINAYKKAYGKSLPVGSEVFVNGHSVGFYEDTAGGEGQWSNTIDIYDPNKQLGSVLKGISKDNYKLTFGKPRKQIPNPSK